MSEDKIFSLSSSFSLNIVKGANDESKKLEIFFIEMHYIVDRRFMFYNCNSLLQFSTINNDESNEINISENKEEKTIDNLNSKHSKHLEINDLSKISSNNNITNSFNINSIDGSLKDHDNILN